jgi:YD repeat-containing protein
MRFLTFHPDNCSATGECCGWFRAPFRNGIRLNQTPTFVYDHLHRQTSETNANGEVTAYAYDALGQRTGLTDPEGNTTTWVYDGLNRVIEETNELNATRYFSYDAVGNLVQ